MAASAHQLAPSGKLNPRLRSSKVPQKLEWREGAWQRRPHSHTFGGSACDRYSFRVPFGQCVAAQGNRRKQLECLSPAIRKLAIGDCILLCCNPSRRGHGYGVLTAAGCFESEPDNSLRDPAGRHRYGGAMGKFQPTAISRPTTTARSKPMQRRLGYGGVIAHAGGTLLGGVSTGVTAARKCGSIGYARSGSNAPPHRRLLRA